MKIIVWLFIMFSLVWVSSAMTPIEFWKSVWANENLVNELRDACQTATDPQHCFGVWLSISNAESNMCNTKTSHWCFGMVWAKDKSAYRWVKSYNKYRYKATDGFFFYGDKWILSKSRYCTSEESSKSKVWCPAWRKNFDTIYNDYRSKVWDKRYDPPLDEWIDDWLINGQKKSCTFVWIIPEWWYIQTDSLLWQLLEIIRPKNKTKQKLFICNQ